MSKRKTLAGDLIKGLRKFVRDLKSGKPIKATRVERYDTPDGPMHVQKQVVLKPPKGTRP